MNPISAIIVDDEDLARDALKLSLKHFKHILIVDECANGFDAIRSVRENKPDVIFLDIQMPKINGFDVVGFRGAGRIYGIWKSMILTARLCD